MPVAQRMTAQEYLATPIEGRTELIGGEIVVHEPRWRHQDLLWRLVMAFGTWQAAEPSRGRGTLPLDLQIGEDNVLSPDLLFYAGDRRPHPERRPSPLPDLAVEVRSPSTWRYDVGVKKSLYEAAGLPELWLVDTDAAVVLVFRRSGPAARTFDRALELRRGDTLGSPRLPGFALDLTAFFAD